MCSVRLPGQPLQAEKRVDKNDIPDLRDHASHHCLCSGHIPKATQFSGQWQIKMTKHILVTNDDGVFAPGLLALTLEE